MLERNSRLLLTATVLLLLYSFASAATIHGKVYEWYSLKELNGVIIDVNSTPTQRFVSQEGSYSFSLPLGDYHLTAKYYSDNTLKYTAEEDISITSEGDFVLDLIMFPLLEMEEEELASLETGLNEEILPEEETKERKAFSIELILVVLVLVIILSVLTYHFYKPPKQEIKQVKKREKKKKSKALKGLDKYAREVIEVLERSGNRLTQKELRQRVSVGEAKVSLIVSELEALGLIKKIKRGRGNIIILKKEKLR